MIKKTAILTITIVLLFCQKVGASEVSVNQVKETIVKHSIALGIEPALALSIAKSESKFRHNLTSPYGAVGVFQLMPATARRLGVNPYYLNDNIKGGLMYYKLMYNMFGSTELALAAYNAGPAAVSRYKKVPPIGETKSFVDSIMCEYMYQKKNPDPAISRALKQKPPKFSITIKPIVNTKPLVKATPDHSLRPVATLKPIIKIINVNNNLI